LLWFDLLFLLSRALFQNKRKMQKRHVSSACSFELVCHPQGRAAACTDSRGASVLCFFFFQGCYEGKKRSLTLHAQTWSHSNLPTAATGVRHCQN
jgi:hypothetical protein